jgi:hypothetical protein
MPTLKDPRAEAFRLERLREVMRQPRSEAWKQNQAAGIRRAIADGRLKINWKALRRAQRISAERRRGKRFSLEHRQHISASLKGKKFPPDRVARMRERGKGTRFPDACYTPEAKAKSIETRRRNGTLMPSRKVMEKAWATSRGRKQSEREIKRRQRANTGKVRDPSTQPHCAKCPEHINARTGALRSPDNFVYPFRNLVHFVRTHEYLFCPDDVMWSASPSRPRQLTCRASKGLAGLYEKRFPRGSWKGWTIAATSLVSDPGRDLLDRNSTHQLLNPPQ